MFLRLSLLVIGVSLSLQLIAQNLILHTIIHHYTEQELEEMWKENKISQWIVPISNGIRLYKIIYTTSWHDGSKIKASGLLFVPDNYAKKSLSQLINLMVHAPYEKLLYILKVKMP